MKHIKFGQTISAFLIMSACFFALSGCQKQEGPLEKAGKEVDQAVDNSLETTGQKIEQAGDKIQDTAKGKP